MKKSRIKLAISRDKARELGVYIGCSVRLKPDKNPERAEILTKIYKEKAKNMFTYVGIEDGLRTFKVN